jgi:hypothetical protein
MADPQFPYPFYPVQFTKDGVIFQPSEVDGLIAGLTENLRPTDLFLMSHGWNNNMDDAKALYVGLAGQLSAQIQNSPALKGRSFAICGVLWPSKKFDDKDLIPSGAASLNDAVTDAGLRTRIADLKDLLQAKGWPVETADAAVEQKLSKIELSLDDWEDDPAVRRQAIELIRELLPRDSADSEDASNLFLTLKPDALVNNLSRTLNPPPPTPGTNAASLDPFAVMSSGGTGGAAGFRDVVGGLRGAFLHLANFTTYYVMKSRAGNVGVKGVEPLIQKIRYSRPDIRIHLIGHSFGCRVVTVAVNALPAQDSLRPNTMTLLEGAFSHNAFASKFDGKNDGAFRQIVSQKKVRGPILISHTRNDKAVGIAYPIASRIAGQVASALGDANDKYGGLGSNGAQTAETTPERVVGTLLDVGGKYPFAAGETSSKPYNLKSDQFISGHSDIVNPQVAFAIAVGMGTPSAI